MNKFYEQIESYLNGDLSPADLQAFEAALQSDPALAADVARHREMLQRLEGMRLRQTVQSAISEMHQEQRRSGSNTRFPVLWVAAAALALLLTAVWFFRQKPADSFSPIPMANNPGNTAPQPIRQPSTPIQDTVSTPGPEVPKVQPADGPRLMAMARTGFLEPNTSSIRNAGNPGQSHETATPSTLAARQYQSGKFQETAAILKKDETVQDDDFARFLRAGARFHLGQFAAAAKDYQALENSLQFEQEARWNFLMCQLAAGNTGLVHKSLNNLIKNPMSPLRQKAQTLENQLRLSGL